MYSKPPRTVTEQIKLLRSRGLVIPDERLAEINLLNFNYYRLSGYWYVLQDDKKAHTFKPGATFDRVLNLYNFDSELRRIVFNAIEHIEVALRTRLSYYYSTIYNDPNWYEDHIYYYNQSQCATFLEELDKEVAKSKDVFVKHHLDTYGNSSRLPTWKALEVISFGKLSRLLSQLKSNYTAHKNIVSDFGLRTPKLLVSTIHNLTVIRNICGHHGRLWNRELQIKPEILRAGTKGWINVIPVDKNKIYLALSVLIYITNSIDNENNLANQIIDLLEKNPFIDTKAMGFTSNWRSEQLWNI